MPVTRAQKKTNSEGGDKVTSARQRNAAKAKSKDGSAQVPAPAASDDPENEDVYFDDEEPDIGKTLHAKDGKLGFVTSKGFVSATNFLVDIAAQVHSMNYSMKGYEVIVKKAGNDSWENFYIPESEIYNPLRLVLKIKSKYQPIGARFCPLTLSFFSINFLVSKTGWIWLI